MLCNNRWQEGIEWRLHEYKIKVVKQRKGMLFGLEIVLLSTFVFDFLVYVQVAKNSTKIYIWNIEMDFNEIKKKR